MHRAQAIDDHDLIQIPSGHVALTQTDAPQLEALFQLHWSRVCSLLYRMLGDWAEAEDLALEAFVRLYRRPPLEQSNLSGWLYRVAANLGFNALRARQRRLKYEQAAVCAAALGGIMVPVYVMPPAMQTISLFSPLAWGLNALVEISVREGTLGSVRHELLHLAAFFAVTMAVAWARFGRFGRQAET